ncbi:YbbR-like domain-containing protein [Bacillus sp. CH126_4D]|uniref:CdaR family protein n=1 Tax=unclassified Bacillus (in: firmicutes) TaxID=185979 RepID=UPI00124DBEC4|nr:MULTISPECIES: CdaR family protein [unclassified Bacillus (in: firmicutes)]KAB2453434.1 YbbR-like domain-containing protein [Bacillus sp. CH140a_4T]KAB2467831.1 YbbR-like domain-containing protein [Bacillus sp. CH126_4D]
MDKLMENHWFLKGISLLLACMLFMSATLTEKNTTSGILPFANDAKETLTNYAINVKYDEEKYIVSGIPAEGVKVKLEGPKAAVATAKAKKQFDIPVDLRDSEKGTYEVSLKTNGLPDDVKGTVQPSTIKITLHEKAKKYVHVDLKLSNEDQMPAGATLEKSNIKPDTVEVVGTKEEIESISSAKAYIDLKGVNKTVTKTAEVTLYNKEGKRLNVRTSPSKISVTLNVATQVTANNNTEKTVPVTYTKKGSLPEGLAVTNISVEPREVTIAGPKDVLDNIQSIEGVEVDLSQLTESTTFDTSVLLPKGVTSAKPNQVKVSVGVQKTKQTKTRTIDGISIQKNGLSKDVTAQLLSPQDGKISVDISGETSIVDKITAAQITAAINLQNVSPGTKDVSIQVSGPGNISIEPKQKSAKVTIVKKENPDKEVQGNGENPDSNHNQDNQTEKPKNPEPEPKPDPEKEQEQNKDQEKEKETSQEPTVDNQKEPEKGANHNG